MVRRMSQEQREAVEAMLREVPLGDQADVLETFIRGLPSDRRRGG
jgi:hypothetical protein